MRVVRRTIVDKIDYEINKGGEIIRIELNNEEFKEAVSVLFHYGKWHGYTKNEQYEKLIDRFNIRSDDGNFNGSHFLYKGYCIQC